MCFRALPSLARRAPWAIILFAILCSTVTPAWAWGSLGHRVIARIAEREAGDKAKSRLRFYLQKEGGPEAVAMWAQDIEAQRPETARWHFVHIPPNATEFKLAEICPQEDCITTKLREFEGIARLAVRSREDVTEAVKFIIHLVGDLHQPLHEGYAEDSGGREIQVVLDGDKMTLYEAWDAALAKRLGSDDAAIADRLFDRITSEQRRHWKEGRPADWTWESHLLAARMAYGALPSGSPKVLGDGYKMQATEVIEQQFMKAGVRLAKILDQVWP